MPLVAPGGGECYILHPSPVLAFFLPLPFAALGGTTSVCWVPHLDETSVPHRSLLDPLHGAAAFVPGSSRGTGAWFWDPLSMASQSPDPRCLLVLGGLLWLLCALLNYNEAARFANRNRAAVVSTRSSIDPARCAVPASLSSSSVILFQTSESQLQGDSSTQKPS